MLFRKKRLKRLRWRDTRSPPSANQVAGEAAENVEESRPPPERHKSSKMMKAKSAMHTLSAIASHSFDIVRELSDSFGPLKGAVNGVWYAKDVWQNAKKIEKDARMLQSEIDAFREQVNSMVPDDAKATAPVQVINSLIRLDKELNDVDATVSTLSKRCTKSRVLHWKECDNQLKAAQAKFHSSREKFLIDCSFATSSAVLLRIDVDRGVHHRDETAQMVEEHIRKIRNVQAENVLKIFVSFSLFDSDGSMGKGSTRGAGLNHAHP